MIVVVFYYHSTITTLSFNSILTLYSHFSSLKVPPSDCFMAYILLLLF